MCHMSWRVCYEQGLLRLFFCFCHYYGLFLTGLVTSVALSICPGTLRQCPYWPGRACSTFLVSPLPITGISTASLTTQNYGSAPRPAGMDGYQHPLTDTDISDRYWHKLTSVTYTDIYWQILTYTEICWLTLTSVTHTDIYWHLLTYTDIYWYLLTSTDNYLYILTSTDIYWHLLTYIALKGTTKEPFPQLKLCVTLSLWHFGVCFWQKWR